jgi:hypothetical protein
MNPLLCRPPLGIGSVRIPTITLPLICLERRFASGHRFSDAASHSVCERLQPLELATTSTAAPAVSSVVFGVFFPPV